MPNSRASYFGLSKPYDFRVAVPFSLGAGFLAVAIAVFAKYGAWGRVHILTSRWWFSLYVAGLAFLAVYPVADLV